MTLTYVIKWDWEKAQTYSKNPNAELNVGVTVAGVCSEKEAFEMFNAHKLPGQKINPFYLKAKVIK